MFRSLVRINQHQIFNRTVNFSKRGISYTPVTITEVVGKWNTLSPEEQSDITKRIEELQKQDWQRLSLEEKKAAYYISFGNYGPREFYESHHTGKIIAGVTGLLIVSGGFFFMTKKAVTERPKTLNKEWEEATNERMRQQKANPITGISSEGYKGKGYVVSD
ncbi:cytochrome c oxidase subunit IV [Rhizophagus irregularis]|uniref:Cytochrome c oxidase subunit IV n=1 Tax=Rhizophagus irregularis TaxID=588596 RepID=A0A2I1GBV0_9GLOM|nr:cytochrome c oxidase subunit IV [Rhizophagus irregularis]